MVQTAAVACASLDRLSCAYVMKPLTYIQNSHGYVCSDIYIYKVHYRANQWLNSKTNKMQATPFFFSDACVAKLTLIDPYLFSTVA